MCSPQCPAHSFFPSDTLQTLIWGFRSSRLTWIHVFCYLFGHTSIFNYFIPIYQVNFPTKSKPDEIKWSSNSYVWISLQWSSQSGGCQESPCAHFPCLLSHFSWLQLLDIRSGGRVLQHHGSSCRIAVQKKPFLVPSSFSGSSHDSGGCRNQPSGGQGWAGDSLSSNPSGAIFSGAA